MISSDFRNFFPFFSKFIFPVIYQYTGNYKKCRITGKSEIPSKNRIIMKTDLSFSDDIFYIKVTKFILFIW